MTAPALVLVAHGSADHGANTTMHAFRKHLQMTRPDLNVNLAFIDRCPPSGPQVVSALVARGTSEVVFVPMSLTAAVEAPDMAELVARTSAAHPSVRFGMARPIGPATELLTLSDRRLREALSSVRATQVDGLVLATDGHSDTRGRALLQRRARQWSAHHKLPCVVALNDSPGTATAAAVASLRAQGRRHIAVGSWWVSSDEAYLAHAQAAHVGGALAVARPLGVDERLLHLALGRYAYAAMALLEVVEETSAVAL